MSHTASRRVVRRIIALVAVPSAGLLTLGCLPEPPGSVPVAVSEIGLFGADEPTTATAAADHRAVNLGVRFASDSAGQVTGLRFYKIADTNPGPHVGNLWGPTGARLAEVTFTGETRAGWQEARFAQPITVHAGVNYTASYFAPKGGYAFTHRYSFGEVSHPPLRARWLTDGSWTNGVYAYAPSAAFPQASYDGTNYWVDVLFRSSSPTSQPAPSPSTPAPSPTPAPTASPPLPGASFTPAYYGRWPNGLPTSASFFPVGVWMQDPLRMRNGRTNALNYRSAGINTFVGLWEWPSRADSAARLQALADAGLYALAGGEGGRTADVRTAMSLPPAATLKGYLLGDEQDQSWDDPATPEDEHVTPAQLTSQAQAVKAADPTRPIYNNFGKPFSMDPTSWYAYDRSDLPKYCREVDIPSADYYAMTDPWQTASEKTPRYYGRAVSNVRRLCGDAKPAYGFIETGHPFANSSETITPAQIEQGVWSMLAHGANGIIYFSHDFYSDGFTEDGMLSRPATLAKISAINAQISSLAPLLNAQRQATGLTTSSAVDATLRQNAHGRYVIAAENGGEARSGTLTVAGAADKVVEVIGEGRTLRTDSTGAFTDSFAGWGHHVYRIR